ncbi:MAG: DegT/DnrJ/EryC1/StrS family aminotransferase [Microthrixaceae bacterium]|nr:DegT/DnrJ/EryC1/StrS family aminotransferase [Microthrixaceae bacterium]
MIPISSVDVPEEAETLVLEVLRSGMLASGPKVAELERLAAQMAGTKHALAVNNGTTALVVALESLQLQPGDEVITTPFTFVATLNAILEAGATARFADIGDDYLIDPASIESLINDRTRVVMPVHLYGQPADMDAISSVAGRHGLHIVEDSAQSHGAALGTRRVGSFGLGCFSLYGTKNVTTGEGGLVTTNDDALADRIAVLRNQGMRARYQYEVPGHNYRLTDLQAAVGIPQLERLDTINDRRNRNAAVLTEGLSGIPGLLTPIAHAGRHHVWHQYTVRITPDAALARDELVEALNSRGVGAGVYYPRTVFDYDCYRSHPQVVTAQTPNATAIASQVLSLPVHPKLSDDDLSTIVTTVRSLLAP